MRWIPLPAAVVTFLLATLPALAQNATKAPSPKQTMAQPWASVVVAFFIMIFIAIASFLSAKRGQ